MKSQATLYGLYQTRKREPERFAEGISEGLFVDLGIVYPDPVANGAIGNGSSRLMAISMFPSVGHLDTFSIYR